MMLIKNLLLVWEHIGLYNKQTDVLNVKADSTDIAAAKRFTRQIICSCSKTSLKLKFKACRGILTFALYQTLSTAPQDEHHTTKDPHGIQCIIIMAIEEDIATSSEL